MTKAMHRIQRKNKFLPYLLTLPSMLLFSMFTFYPFLKTIALSFFLTDKRGNPTKWAGISNWVRVLSKETFWKVIAITLEIAGINLVFTFGLAIFLCTFVLAEEKRRKAVPDDVCTADGNSFFSCSSDLSVYLSAEKRCGQQPVGRREYRLDDRDALRHVGCLHYDDLDECGYQLHFFAGWFPGCAAGSDRKCLSGRCRCLGKDLACYAANGIPADILRSVLEYCDLFPQLCTDQIADRRWTCQCNEEPYLLYLRKCDY